MELKKELNEAFGLELDITEENDKSGLSRYLTSGRKIYKAQDGEIVFYVVKLPTAVDSRVLYKELAAYEKKYEAGVAFWFDRLTKNSRNAYVKHHIPFLMPPTQIYLPFLGILLGRKMSGTERKNTPVLSANAQKILLFMIYHAQGEYIKQQLADKLELDPVYVTRGTKELSISGLVTEEKRGRYMIVRRDRNAKELFELSRNLLASPVNKVIYVKKTKVVMGLPKAGDYALSEISMLNPPEIETYACYKKNRLIDQFEIVLEPGWEDSGRICRVELWNYDPLQLASDERVDDLSLFCSFKQSKDARIQGELEKVMEERKWL